MLNNIQSKYYYYASICLILICAYFSEGFLHPDEHYQILELTNLKLGKYTDSSIFNWDYNLQIRPWFQSFLYFVILKPLFFLDSFNMAFIIRAINGLLGLFAIKLTISHFSNKKNINDQLLLATCIWFVPLILVRTNSESLSTTLFLFASYFFLKQDFTDKNKFVAGILFGLSFITRYQMGIPIFAVNILYLITQKNFKNFFLTSIGIAAAIALGTLIDWWGYGNFTIAPYNYFRENILHSKASNFGTDPIWYYITKPFIKGIPVITLFLYFYCFKYFKKAKVNYWTISFISFFVIHSLIPHKEMRFLHFNYVLAVLFFVSHFDFKKFPKKLIVFIYAINLIVLLKILFLPAASEIELYRQVYKLNIQEVGVFNHQDKFQFTMPFYQKGKISTVIYSQSNTKYILTTKFHEYIKYKSLLEKCDIKYQKYPFGISNFNYFNWLKRSSFMILWDCKKRGVLPPQ